VRLEHADFWTENFSHFEEFLRRSHVGGDAQVRLFRLHQVEQLLGARVVGELGASRVRHARRLLHFCAGDGHGLVRRDEVLHFLYEFGAAIETMTNEA
jgi:hypothetical protein